MRAAVLVAPGRVDVVEDWPSPEGGPRDVVVAVEGVGVCGTDLAVFHGRREVPGSPWVMGHEGFGRIVAVGTDVVDRQVGQRVVIEPNYACLECVDCRMGLTSACPRRAIVGLNSPGVLAERVVVPAPFAHPVGSAQGAASAGELGAGRADPADLAGLTDPAGSISLADLACAEPYAVARAAVRRSGVTARDRCLVVGAGAQGLLVCLTLARLGAVPVVTEPHPLRLEKAVRLGAVADDGRGGFTYVFETSGYAPALSPAVERAAPGATVVLVGLNSEPLPLSTDDVVRRQLVVRGSMIYDHPGDFTAAVAELPAARPGRVIEAGFSLTEAQEAFAGASSRAGKTWIRIGSGHA
ncbi:alcohol dehydrogenase catalytic domain-containing protein [Streptomyces niveiscabiei]|uniref:zinc-dependent alcohol dehydrogenase n=1 Tax=Streptomyces niveiscabiei TaxID=164115 RepID=UPI0029A544EE|nr:alcohol dehydrogenase catalytic domain-containing protein [Streptomyces niveiscabiei]MDX3382085.1 alcohol dehydrogenase catalytic domain-containing protein [Streptomyces niveiscabiei]